MASLSSLVYCLWARPETYPRVEHLKGSSLLQTPAFATSNRLSWKASGDKHSSLLRKFVKSFIISPRVQCYKTFNVRNLRMFVTSQSVSHRHAFPTQPNVCENGWSLPKWSTQKKLPFRVGTRPYLLIDVTCIILKQSNL